MVMKLPVPEYSAVESGIGALGGAGYCAGTMTWNLALKVLPFSNTGVPPDVVRWATWSDPSESILSIPTPRNDIWRGHVRTARHHDRAFIPFHTDRHSPDLVGTRAA